MGISDRPSTADNIEIKKKEKRRARVYRQLLERHTHIWWEDCGAPFRNSNNRK